MNDLSMAAWRDDTRIMEVIKVASPADGLSGPKVNASGAHTLSGKKPCSGVIDRKMGKPGQDRPMLTNPKDGGSCN